MTLDRSLHEHVLGAYGGAAAWTAARTIALRVSAHGAAFLMKWQRPMRKVPSRVAVREPNVRFEMRPGLIGVFAGQEVRLERPDGAVVESRIDPKRYFPGGRRALWWDQLDQIYFAGYALWNYVTFPALLSNPEIRWEQAGQFTLRAEFPDGFPTHSREQEFHVDPNSGLLVQHDYTAEVFGGWAKGAHRVLEHERVGGLMFGTRRRVTPRRGNGTPGAFPLLVGIEFEDIRVDP